MSGYAEHNMIRRGRIGVGSTFSGGGASGARLLDGTFLGYTTQQIDDQWIAGVNSMSPGDVGSLRAATMQAMAAGYAPSQAAQASINKWDAYSQKLATVSKMTPAQYAQYKAQGSGSGLGGALAKLPVVGGLLSKIPGLGGLAMTPAPVVVQPQTSFLDDLLSPVGLVLTVVTVGTAGYFATRKKAPAPAKKGARRR